MINNKIKYDGRSADLTLQWLIKKHGEKWEVWRQYAEEWITNQDVGQQSRLDSLCIFFDIYLAGKAPWTFDITTFFEERKNEWQASNEDFMSAILKNTKRGDNRHTVEIINHIFYFIDWLLDTYFSERGNNGNTLRLYTNPFKKQTGKKDFTE